jgi:hypothetical protein
MKSTIVMRFIVLGAIGFGISGALPFVLPYQGVPWLVEMMLIKGAVGGASLGLAFMDSNRVVVLALLGALGLFVGVFAGQALGVAVFNYSVFDHSDVPIAAFAGAVVGASLGVAFLDWRTILALAVAGAVGFGVGTLPSDFIRFPTPTIPQLPVGVSVSYAITGIIGGATLGAVLGNREYRRLAERQRQKVR